MSLLPTVRSSTLKLPFHSIFRPMKGLRTSSGVHVRMIGKKPSIFFRNATKRLQSDDGMRSKYLLSVLPKPDSPNRDILLTAVQVSVLSNWVGVFTIVFVTHQITADLKREIKATIKEIRVDIKSDIIEIRSDIAEIRSDIAEIRSDITSLTYWVGGIYSVAIVSIVGLQFFFGQKVSK